MCNITINHIVLVKDKTTRYSFDRDCSSPKKAVDVFNAVFGLEDLPQEVLCALYLNTKNQIVGIQEVTRGTVDRSLATAAEIYKAAILHNASHVIMAHNHPSGDPEPSREDISVTQRIAEAGRILEIPLLDHVIIGDSSFVSLCERGYI
jgi:DNA repair protein RadC